MTLPQAHRTAAAAGVTAAPGVCRRTASLGCKLDSSLLPEHLFRRCIVQSLRAQWGTCAYYASSNRQKVRVHVCTGATSLTLRLVTHCDSAATATSVQSCTWASDAGINRARRAVHDEDVPVVTNRLQHRCI